MNVSGRKFIKRLLLFMLVGVVTVSCAGVVFANTENIDEPEQTTELPKEAEFEEEQAPLSSVPGAVDDVVGPTPFGVLSAIGSYSLLIPALLLAIIALVIAAIFRKREKPEAVK